MTGTNGHNPNDQPIAGRELSSWKEIAAYLGVGVRTAQVWEQDRGLPIKRLPGPRARVLANTAALDAWKESGTVTVQTPALTDAGDGPAGAPTTPAAKRLPTRTWWLLAASIGLAGAALLLARVALPGLPASVSIQHSTLIAFDDHGRECWRKTFSPGSLPDNVPGAILERRSWVGDLDGERSVLFGLATADNNTPLVCYDRHGRERWRYSTSRRVRTATETFNLTYGPTAILVTNLGKRGGDAILVSIQHNPYYPTNVVLLNADGKLLREYWHSGHLEHLRAADLDGDQMPEFYLAGINNARKAATIVVLDLDHFGGASQEDDLSHALQDLGEGRERKRIILPRSCINETFAPYNTPTEFVVTKDEIRVEVAELLSPNDAGIIHTFTPEFARHQATLTDSYRIATRRLRSQLASCPSDEDRAAHVIALSH